MAEGENQIPQNRSMLRDFIGSISVMQGDLSNITAPPFVLDTKSTVELPSFWAENPSVFCAPAQSDDPATRALLVLKWYLSSLRNQNYMGHSEDHGVKKPLNAFLGETFIARYEDDMGTTRLVSEQVSHHPPITACRVWNDEYGVAASGYTRQSITFNGSVSIKQIGHALFRLSKHDETYLIPLPELKVKGVLSGTPYPELSGKYYIPSTNGYMSVINFSGKGWFSGQKHAVEAALFKEDEGEDHPLYTIKGTWNTSFTIHNETLDEDVEIVDILAQSQNTTDLIVEPIHEQDPWESRRAWADVISALNSGDFKGVIDAKNKVEQGQRQMRKDEQRDGIIWEQKFFTSSAGDEIAEELLQKIPGNRANLQQERKDTRGVWTFDAERWEKKVKPYRGDMVPDNSHRSASTSTRNSIDSSARNSMYSMRNSLDSGSVMSSRTATTASSSRSASTRNSVDTHRTSIDSTTLSTTSDYRRKRSSIGSKLASFSPFGRRSQDASDNMPSSPRSSLSTVSTPDSAFASMNIHQDTPEPQVAQALHSEKVKTGSGIDGMSLSEKVQIEEALRNANTSYA